MTTNKPGMTDTREEIIEAMAQAIALAQYEHEWGDEEHRDAEYVWTMTSMTNKEIQRARARSAYEVSPLERYRAALEEIAAWRPLWPHQEQSDAQQRIAERALREVVDGR